MAELFVVKNGDSVQKTFYPMTFTPVLKNYIWGGRNFETRLDRKLPSGVVAESWEIAGHEDGVTVVENGFYCGKLLTDVHKELGLDLIGRNSIWAQERGKFPLLIKLLDANRPLSVQVHPDDTYAMQHEGNELGKTEMWVVLHAGRNAKLILGLKKKTTYENFLLAARDGQLERYLHEIPVKTGDHIAVPTGSVHAILGGLILAEIQQNSNTTYRIFDWNRRGNDGKPRPLHLERAMDVINFNQIEPALTMPELVSEARGIRRLNLESNRYFTVERVEMVPGSVFYGHCDGSTFEIWGVISGDVSVECSSDKLEIAKIRFTLLPAALGKFSIKAKAGAQLLRVYVKGKE